MPWQRYVKDVLIRGVVVAAISFILPFLMYKTIPPTIYRFILLWLVSFTISGLVIYWLGMDPEERAGVKSLLNRIIHRK